MKRATLWIVILAAFSPTSGAAENVLDELSLEELVKTEITSVSRRSQSMTDIPAAAFVITAEDIRRSGAQALPDVLRMAPGIEVAQIDNGRYAVSARGFNGRFANKLQVLVDGRSIYHPIFSGVTWELDPIPLEDIERIEIIRGAGAVMWGANAVNGVINIISKHTHHQDGSAVSVSAGNKGTANVYARIGQQASDATSWKLSAQGRHIEPSKLYGSDADSVDRLENAVVDFRLDHDLASGRDLSIWGNASRSTTRELWDLSFPGLGISLFPVSPTQKLHSESLVGRYRWLSDHGIESSIQASATTSGIDITNFIREERTTYDLDYQGRYAFGRHDILWGLSHRRSSDEVSSGEPYISFRNPSYIQRNTGLFVHDDWTLIPDNLKLGVGIRGDKTSANGTNLSTNATLLWTPTRADSAWLKFAQAPRTSSRAERDVSILTGGSAVVFPGLGTLPMVSYVNGGGQVGPEKARGLEVGFRKQFSSTFSADINAYRYRYTHLRSGSQTGMTTCSAVLSGFSGIPYDPTTCATFGIPDGTPLLFNFSATDNSGAGWSDGVELSADWLVTANWRLQLSYTWSKLRLDASSNPGVDAGGEITERAAPRHYGSLRSQWNITRSQQFDLWIRGAAGLDRFNLIDPVPNATGTPTYTRVPGYITLDLRYAYRINKDLEFALIGRNLLHSKRLEYVSDFIPSAATAITPTWLISTRWSF
ncbi:MAG: TonB-dependent receptor [Azonexaceae bacterium]|nr:TonB-dependent receptor [Azonexaceae bacterium]